MRDVVVGRPAVVLGVEDVGERHRAVVVRVEIDRAAESVRVQERDVVRRAALELDQQAVVLDVAAARQRADRAQRRRDSRVRAVDVLIGDAERRARLIQVRLQRRVHGARPGVRRLHHVVRSELPLHVHVEVVRVRVAEVGEERRARRAGRRELGMNAGRRRQAVREQDVGAERRRERLRLQERLVLRLRRRRAARREVPEQPVAAAHDGPAVAGDVVREAEARAEVRLAVRLQIASHLHAVDHRAVRRDDEAAGRRVEVRLLVVHLDPRNEQVVADAGVHRQPIGHADVVLDVRRDLGPDFRIGAGIEQRAARIAGEAEEEAREVEAAVVDERAPARDARAVRRQVLVEVEASDDRVGVQDLARAMRPRAAGAQRLLAHHVRHVVVDLEVVLVRDERLIAVRAHVPHAAVVEHDLRKRGGDLVQVDARDADRLREVLLVVDRRHEELDRAPAEAELVQQTRAERVRIVEGESLRLDVAVARAEGEARVAVRQRRRQDAMRFLVAVAREEAVVRRQPMIDLEIDLVVEPRQRRVDQVVVDRLPVRSDRPAGVRFGNDLAEHLRRHRIHAVRRNHVAGERQVRDRVVDDAV